MVCNPTGRGSSGTLAAFFENVFGWEFQLAPESGFLKTNAVPSTLQGGGIFTLRRARLLFLTLYIQVDNIQEKVRLIQEHGGFIVDPSAELAAGQWICTFNAPSGVTFARILMA